MGKLGQYHSSALASSVNNTCFHMITQIAKSLPAHVDKTSITNFRAGWMSIDVDTKIFAVCDVTHSIPLGKISITCAIIFSRTDRKCKCTVYPKKYAHGFCFAVLCCGYTLTNFPISIRLTSLALWQSNDCPSASKANLMNMDKYFMWIH